MADWLRKITNSAMITLTLLSPHRNSPRTHPISKITVHHTAGNIGLHALLDWLHRATTRASYNYGISSLGEVGLIVNECDRSWASGSAWNDNRAVTISVANNRGAPEWGVSDEAFTALIDLCVDICKRNPGIVREDGRRGLWYDGTQNGSLTRHNMYSNQICPGPYLQSRFPEIVRLVNERLDRELEAAPAPEGVNVEIGGVTLQVPAQNVDGRWVMTLPDGPEGQPQPDVLLRVVLEALGLSIRWDDTTQTIIAVPRES